MPLVAHQNVVYVNALLTEKAIPKLIKALETFPPCRIISISITDRPDGVDLVAVVETLPLGS